MQETLLTVTQALQLVGLAPCLLVTIYLLLPAQRFTTNLLAIFYFLSLGASFLVALLPAFTEKPGIAYYLLATLKDTNIAFSYLLAVQLILTRIPSWPHFLVLAIPLVWGNSFIYAASISEEICFTGDICIQTNQLDMLYDVASASIIFLLLIFSVSRLMKEGAVTTLQRHHYWLIISLVLVNLALLALNLLRISELVNETRFILAGTIIRLTFVYLVISSIFRVSTEAFVIKPLQAYTTSNKEQAIIAQIENLLNQEKSYREQGFNRATLARQLAIGEQQLSRIINAHFKKSFSDLANEHRINEAKQLLRDTNQPVTNIAFDTGFNSLSSFNRVFKEMTGLSPSEFRTEGKKA